jgi:hypothetical protein
MGIESLEGIETILGDSMAKRSYFINWIDAIWQDRAIRDTLRRLLHIITIPYNQIYVKNSAKKELCDTIVL